MNTPDPAYAKHLAKMVLLEHWRRVYGPTHPIIGATFWEPQCHVCGTVLLRDGQVWRCPDPYCDLCGKPAPADLGLESIRKLLTSDEEIGERLREGYRTSQKEAFTVHGKRITAVIGGNRGGKSAGAGPVSVATALGRAHPAVQVWAHDCGFKLEDIPNEEPHVFYAISPTHEASVQYTRPTIEQFLPRGTIWHNRMGTSVAMAHLPGPNGEPPVPTAQPGQPGFYGRIVFKAVKQGREAFQGVEVAGAWFDEEPLDRAVFGEVVTRCADVGGRTYLSMTPLEGRTYLYYRLVRDRDPDAVVHELTGLHNPTGLKRGLTRADGLAREALADIRQGNAVKARQRICGMYGDVEGLVYPVFNDRLHVFDDYADLPPREECWIYGGFDDGTVNPLAYLHAWYHPKTATWWVVKEIYREQMLISDLASELRAIWVEWGTPGEGRRPGAVYADSAAAKTLLELRREHRIGFRPCTKGAGSVREQIRDTVKPVLAPDVRGHVHYRVHASCRHHRAEFGLYRWPEGTDRRSPAENPVGKDDHSMDAMRYMLHGAQDDDRKRRRGRALREAAAKTFGSHPR